MRLIGHRGARGEAPENTLSGFRYLRSLGVRAVELDIQVSGSGELVVIHDTHLARSTHSHGEVALTTTADLAQTDACHRAFPEWPSTEGVPSLRAVMALLHDFEHIQFEVKAQSMAHCRVVAQQLPALWHEFGFHQGDDGHGHPRALTTSFNTDYLRLIAARAPELSRGFLYELDFTGDAVATAQRLGCVSLGPHHARCDAALIAAAHAAGLQVSPWTVNEVARMHELAAHGADSLITDFPRMALQHSGLFTR